MKSENSVKIYIDENKAVSIHSAGRPAKKKGVGIGDQSRNVIENTCRKNVAFSPFHYVIENK